MIRFIQTLLLILHPTYKVLRMLSIDVVLGAVFTGWMASTLLEQPMPLSWWIGLPIAVWIYYTGDHLLDAYRLGINAHTPRHLFHAIHFQPIGIIWAILLIVGGSVLPFYLPFPLLLMGLGIGILGIIHLGLTILLKNKVSVWLQKELGVGLIYTLGIWIGPVAIYPDKVEITYFLIAFQFFFLAMINLLIFSLFEINTDRKDGHSSWVRALGPHTTRNIILLFAACIILLNLHIMFNERKITESLSQVIVCSMLGLLMSIIVYPEWFRQKERYRMLGDAVFMFPVFIPLLENW